MPVPAVNLANLRQAAAVTPPTLTPGADSPGFAAFGPLVEPLSAGPLPVRPNLVQRGRAAAHPVRRMRARSGHLKRTPIGTTGSARARFTVQWGALTRAEAASLRDFFENDVIAAEGSGGLFGFDLKPDGPDGSTIVVRPLGTLRTRIIDGGGGADPIEGAAEIEVEELF